MKKLLVILMLFKVGYGQVVYPRSPIGVIPQDARLYTTFNLKIPVYADTTTATAYMGHDSVGLVFYNRADSMVYIRDLGFGVHRWKLLGPGTGGAVIDVFGRVGHVVALTGDYAAFYPVLSGSYANPTWISSLAAGKITGTQSVTAGSSKVTLGGTPTGAAFQPFSIDVVPANILLSTLGGQLGIAQINATGAASSSTFLRGDGTWSSPGTTVTGLPNTWVGAGYRLTFNFTNDVRTLFSRGYLVLDSTTNSNGITFYPDTSAGKLATKTDIISGTFTMTNKTIAAGSNTITGLTNTNLSGSAGITNANLANSTISGVALGGTLFTHIPGFGLSGSNYTGAASQTWIVDTSLAHGPASKDWVTARLGGGGGSSPPFSDGSTLIKNSVDGSKQIIISAVNLTTATIRTYTGPDVNGVLSLEANTATLTNKTIAAGSNTITGLTNTNLSGSAAIVNANLNTMPNNTVKGNVSGGTAVPSDLTATQLTTIPNAFTTTLKGLAPASGGGTTNFLRADGTWAPPPGITVDSGMVNQFGIAQSIVGSTKFWRVDTAALYAAKISYFVNGLGLGLVNQDSVYLGGSPLIRDTHLSGSNSFFLSFDSMKLYYRPVASTIQNLDTTNRKVLTWNPTTKQIDVTYWQVPGAGGGSSLTRQSITSGTSGTVTGGNYLVKFNPSSAIATYTLTLPASPSDLQTVEIEFGGTLLVGTVVTSLTVLPNSGQTLIDNAYPTSATTMNFMKWVYDASLSTWYRRNY